MTHGVDLDSGRFGDLHFASSAMREAAALLAKVAPTDLSCVVTGETGTGKELAARALHQHSDRAAMPFVVVDCGSVQRNLIESELFGHERGAFTGAERARAGAFETADKGTLFLDEIGELPLDLQPKLLRVLERGEIKRLGASRRVVVDVRVVAATHRDLPAMVDAETFREDLFYRLAEVVVALPALRDRVGGAAFLAERFLKDLNGELTPGAKDALNTRRWPGNVRELRNVLRRAAVMSEGPIEAAHFAPLVTGAQVSRDAVPLSDHLPLKEARELWLEPLERRYLVAVLARHEGDLTSAAAHIGLHKKSLERLLRKHALKPMTRPGAGEKD